MRKQIVCALMALSLVLSARTAYIVYAQTATAAELRTQLTARYDIVALQEGIALVPKQANARVRMVQIVNGAVTVDGDTLTAAQLRERLGADAATVIQLTYLSAVEQRQLASPGAAPAPAPEVPAVPSAPETPTSDAGRDVRRDGDVVRIGGGPVNVAENERVQGDVVSIAGPVNVDGEVTGDVVSVMGHVTLGPHAVVRGDVTAVGGGLTRDAKAQVFGKVNEVGAGGQTITSRAIARNIFGTFAARVGSLATTIARVIFFVLLTLIVIAIGHRPVEQIAARVAAEPLRAGLVGLLAEILFVPVLIVTIVALVVSIIGIPLLILVPFAVILVGVVMLVGFTGAACIVGGRALDRFGYTGTNPYLSVAVGAVVIAAITLLGKLAALAVGPFGIPLAIVGYLLEYLAWTIGFGAAILAWIQMRRTPRQPAMATAPPVAGEA